MKKICMLLVLITMSALTACGNNGNIDHVQVLEWDPSGIYTDDEIEAAMRTVEDYFYEEFAGCTLTELYYPGDAHADEFDEWAAHYGADEAIVLYSAFDVDSAGGDGSFNPNSTYRGWKWILIRNENGDWEHKDHGYG